MHCIDNDLSRAEPDIEITPTSLNFGSVEEGSYMTKTFTIKNVGNSPLFIEDMSIDGEEEDSPFLIYITTLTLKPEGEYKVQVTFLPEEEGASESRVVILSNDPDESPAFVDLTAEGVAIPVPGIDVEPDNVEFGYVSIGETLQSEVVIKSVGTLNLTVSEIFLDSGTSTDFDIVFEPSPVIMAPETEQKVFLSYSPSNEGTDEGLLMIKSDDPDEPLLSVPLSGASAPYPDIELDPDSLDFGEVDLGSSSTLSSLIHNMGSATLNISSVNLVGSSDFSITLDPSGLSIPPNDFEEIEVTYTVSDRGGDSGEIYIYSDDPDENPAVLYLYGEKLEIPDIEVNPLSHDFGIVEIGTSLSLQSLITNRGDADLEITSVTLSATSEFSITYDPTGEIISPFDYTVIEISYTPSTTSSSSGSVYIYSNDPDENPVEITIEGEPLLEPDIDVSPSTLDFGSIGEGSSLELSATITNTGTIDLSINSVSIFGNRYFSLTTDPSGSTLSPGTSTTLSVTYSPSYAGNHSGMVYIYSNDPDENPYPLPLTGIALEVNDPPVADAGVDISAYPLDIVTLDGSGSYDPDGDYPLTFSWRLISQPSGSTTTISSSSSVYPTLYCDLAGTYVAGLTVTDTEGASSAEDTVTITVIPWQDIHIQLVWTTSETDLDLHLIRSGGSFYDSPSDCCYCNMNPEWGDPYYSDDNPSLDIDDINGYGPENINIIDPYDGTYYVYVYYYGEEGFWSGSSVGGGPTTATVRVYLNGLLQAEYTRTLTTLHTLWQVLTITWPSGSISTIGTTSISTTHNCY